MFYHIQHYPSRTISGWGPYIQLWPDWKDAVAECGLTQKEVNTAIESMGRTWLNAHGYGAEYDPDNCGHDRDESKPPGPNAEPLYKPRDIRISWGEWGPEHITVPGNACGLDISYGYTIGAPPGGQVLVPHNVDSIYQASLLIVVFLFFADTLILHRLCEDYKKKGVL